MLKSLPKGETKRSLIFQRDLVAHGLSSTILNPIHGQQMISRFRKQRKWTLVLTFNHLTTTSLQLIGMNGKEHQQ